MPNFKLKRTTQCAKCPWRKDVNPHDIPNGYSAEKHHALESTIARPGDYSCLTSDRIHIMACHESGGKSWMVSFTRTISRDGGVTVGAEDFQLARRIVARNDRLHRGHGALYSMRPAIPIDVVYFQERNECLTTTCAPTAQDGDNLGSGIIAITPRGIGSLSEIDFALSGDLHPLLDFGPVPITPPPFLRSWLDVVGAGQLASAGFAASGSTIAAFDVRAELLQRLRFKASRACFHSLTIAQIHCIGWLMNQLGPGNNIGLRLQMRNCENANKLKLAGEQRETFEETLPSAIQTLDSR